MVFLWGFFRWKETQQSSWFLWIFEQKNQHSKRFYFLSIDVFKHILNHLPCETWLWWFPYFFHHSSAPASRKSVHRGLLPGSPPEKRGRKVSMYHQQIHWSIFVNRFPMKNWHNCWWIPNFGEVLTMNCGDAPSSDSSWQLANVGKLTTLATSKC